MATDFTPAPTQPPSFIVTIVQAAGQHALTALAGVLVTAGVIQSSQTAEVLDLGGSLIAACLGLAWHIWLSRQHQANANQRVAQAAITGKIAP